MGNLCLREKKGEDEEEEEEEEHTFTFSSGVSGRKIRNSRPVWPIKKDLT